MMVARPSAVRYQCVCAGAGFMPIVFGGVQSVAPAIKKALEQNDGRPPHLRHFGWRDLLLIDECHLLSDKEDSFYQYIIAELRAINPHLKVIGFTATPYRMKMGMPG